MRLRRVLIYAALPSISVPPSSNLYSKLARKGKLPRGRATRPSQFILLHWGFFLIRFAVFFPLVTRVTACCWSSAVIGIACCPRSHPPPGPDCCCRPPRVSLSSEAPPPQLRLVLVLAAAADVPQPSNSSCRHRPRTASALASPIPHRSSRSITASSEPSPVALFPLRDGHPIMCSAANNRHMPVPLPRLLL